MTLMKTLWAGNRNTHLLSACDTYSGAPEESRVPQERGGLGGGVGRGRGRRYEAALG